MVVCLRRAGCTGLSVLVTSCAAPPPPASTPAAPPPAARHLLLHYPFDDCTAKDVGGGKRDGVIHGAPACAQGPLGKAMVFDGEHDYFTIPPIPDDPFSVELTITGWIKAYGFGNGSPRWVTILTIGNESMEAPLAVVYAVDEKGRFFPHTRITSVTGQLQMPTHAESAGTEGKWTFFAWSFNRGTLKIYENGALRISFASGVPQLAETSEPIDVGRDVPGATEYLKGVLDDLRIYDYELTPDELEKVRALGHPPSGK
jgi:hypothetical protein